MSFSLKIQYISESLFRYTFLKSVFFGTKTSGDGNDFVAFNNAGVVVPDWTV